MKKLFYITLLFAALISCNYAKKPVYVEYFKQGDTLPPDYAIPDTLIVIDAIGLNKEMGLIEQGINQAATDSEISELFYKYCKVIN